MAIETVRKLCSHCNAPRVLDPTPGTCWKCGDTGSIAAYWIDHGDNVFHSNTILEELDPSEHAGLTDTQKDGVLTILSCGLVDLNVGKVGRVRLWNWFGAQSTTVASLTALLV
jgi:hypothetical protein